MNHILQQNRLNWKSHELEISSGFTVPRFLVIHMFFFVVVVFFFFVCLFVFFFFSFGVNFPFLTLVLENDFLIEGYR